MIKALRPFIMFVLIITFSFTAMGCLSKSDTKKDTKKESKNTANLNMPDWFLNPPKSDAILYATGYAKKKNPQLSVIAAGDNARAELSRMLEVKINTITKQFLEEAGVKDDKSASEFAQIVSSSVSSNILFFSKIEKQDLIPDQEKYIAYVLIRLDLKDMKDSINGTLTTLKEQFAAVDKGSKDPESELEELANEIQDKLYNTFNKTNVKQDKKLVIRELTQEKGPESVQVTTGRTPDWVSKYPISNEYYIGVAQGKDVQQAKDSALTTLVTQIEVRIKAQIDDFMKEAKGVSEEEVSQSIKLSVRDNIEDLELVGLWKSNDDQYWAYFRLNIERYKQKEQQKMENAKINALDFLKRSDAETDPSLKFKYAFLGYYLIGKYVTRTLKADYNGNEVILVNELTSRIQKILSEFIIISEKPKVEIDKINPKAINVDFNIKYRGAPVNNFPVIFENNKGNLDISKGSVTDSQGFVTCILNKALASDAMQSFMIKLDISKFVSEAAESEEDILVFYNRLTKLGIPSKEVLVKVNPPVFNFVLSVENDLGSNRKYIGFVQSMASNFKNILSKQTGSLFTDDPSRLKMKMTVDGSISQSENSGQYFTRIIVAVNIIDTASNEEVFSKSTPNKGIKGGSVTEEKSVRTALDNYLEEYNEKMIGYILDFMTGKKDTESDK